MIGWEEMFKKARENRGERRRKSKKFKEREMLGRQSVIERFIRRVGGNRKKKDCEKEKKEERNKENRQYLKEEENIEYQSPQVRENVSGRK